MGQEHGSSCWHALSDSNEEGFAETERGLGLEAGELASGLKDPPLRFRPKFVLLGNLILKCSNLLYFAMFLGKSNKSKYV